MTNLRCSWTWTGWVLAAVFLPLGCGSSGAMKDGGLADGAAGAAAADAADTGSPPEQPRADAASEVGGGGHDGATDIPDSADVSSGDIGSQEAGGGCKTNADCGTGRMCFFANGTTCVGSDGVCVVRLDAACSQNVGGGCPCLDLEPAACQSHGNGAACRGSDQAAQCWGCYVPS